MKSLEELKAIREQMKKQMDVRDQSDSNIRVAVGMATCGIAAGAKPVLAAFLDEIQKRDLHGVTVTQTGCIGVCRLEPVVEVFAPGEDWRASAPCAVWVEHCVAWLHRNFGEYAVAPHPDEREKTGKKKRER